jgi:hypothetical protein
MGGRKEREGKKGDKHFFENKKPILKFKSISMS